ncbi:nuclease HARBI1 [Trichonephila clavipes]|nr:nuclease HARBI1 [Trichonephila clavipes]
MFKKRVHFKNEVELPCGASSDCSAICEAIASLLPDFIHLPVNREECKTVSRKFFSIAGFSKVIGALDGTFVRIVSPGGEDAEGFAVERTTLH